MSTPMFYREGDLQIGDIVTFGNEPTRWRVADVHTRTTMTAFRLVRVDDNNESTNKPSRGTGNGR